MDNSMWLIPVFINQEGKSIVRFMQHVALNEYSGGTDLLRL
ncbi:hypothetical protein PCL1606_04810 [Pseudomonas chlororaphis]|uniref:Uncharacterized protein n=1 Tax=Pseudomonas chlororaphis TaxID=587753 RepID=A0A0D5XS69_9PSED|nr:hypothetical protein PCL1606_04810 [Pseudomonas chlororaphis]